MPDRYLSGLTAHLILCTMLLAPLACIAQAIDIPALGESASQVLSPRAERRIGTRFYRQMRSQSQFITDSQINHYIQSLGDKLLNRNDLGNERFTFFVLDNPAINAFAVPGGYIGIFRGLIDIMANESQLASVVAHEIAHVTQRHLARLYARQAGVSLAASAAVIAAIVAAAKGAGHVSGASFYAGIAASEQSRINFTRVHEQEADRIGIQLLANGNYNANSMAAMLTTMQNASLHSGSESLEFLRTHPLSSRRIAETQAQAAAMDTRDTVIDNVEFQLIKARLKVLTSDNLPLLLRRYERHSTTSQIPGDIYALALTQQLLSKQEQAARSIRQLASMAPESITVQLLQANNLVELGYMDEALLVYAELQDNYPSHYPILEAYCEALIRIQRYRIASTLLEDYLSNVSMPSPKAHKLLAFQLQQLDELADSRVNMADYFLKTDELDAALNQLRLALKEPDISAEEKQRINAKLDDVKHILSRSRE